MTGSQCDRLA